jgi:hypothetical protein
MMTDDKHNASRELMEMETRRRETRGIDGISAIWSGRLVFWYDRFQFQITLIGRSIHTEDMMKILSQISNSSLSSIGLSPMSSQQVSRHAKPRTDNGGISKP